MLRALETVKQVIEQAGVVEKDCQYFVRGDLACRSFGVFTNTNQSLLRSALGYEIFENLVHSSEASPLGGEGIVSVHRRCERFYTKQILPHLLIGDNVLIVTHSCNLNVMAYVLAKKEISNYRAFDIPHGKIIDSENLIDLMDAETSGLSYHISNAEKYLTYMVAEFSASAFMMGVFLRLIIGENLPDMMYYICLILFLGTSNFYALLKVNVRSAFQKVRFRVVFVGTIRSLSSSLNITPTSSLQVPLKLWISVIFTYFLRSCVSTSILWSVASKWDDTIEGLNVTSTSMMTDEEEEESQKTALLARWTLWWILPPAMNTTSLSVWMGGDLYPSAAISMFLSIFVPPMIVLLVYLTPGESRLIEVDKLDFFYFLLVGGFLVPTFFAQILRMYSPVGSKKHGNRWQLFGVASYIATVFMTG